MAILKFLNENHEWEQVDVVSDGVTFIPSIAEDGTLSWSNNGSLQNPDPVMLDSNSVIIRNTKEEFPVDGNINLLYLERTNNNFYRWDSVSKKYVKISSGGGSVDISGKPGNILTYDDDHKLYVPAGGGTIEISEKEDNILTFDDNNKLYVPKEEIEISEKENNILTFDDDNKLYVPKNAAGGDAKNINFDNEQNSYLTTNVQATLDSINKGYYGGKDSYILTFTKNNGYNTGLLTIVRYNQKDEPIDQKQFYSFAEQTYINDDFGALHIHGQGSYPTYWKISVKPDANFLIYYAGRIFQPGELICELSSRGTSGSSYTMQETTDLVSGTKFINYYDKNSSFSTLHEVLEDLQAKVDGGGDELVLATNGGLKFNDPAAGETAKPLSVDFEALSNKYLDKTSTTKQTTKAAIQVGDHTTNIANAYLHMRKVSATSTGSTVNGACFSVNGDGTASFQHKIYNNDGTGAKNAAILRFYGKATGEGKLQFAVNTGTGASPTEDMYEDVAMQKDVPVMEVSNVDIGAGAALTTGTFYFVYED